VVIAVVVTVVLGIAFHRSGTTGFDRWVARTATEHIGAGGARFLLDVSEPLLTLGIILLVAGAAAVARRWDLLIVAAIGPATAVVLTEYVLKDLVSRYLDVPGLPSQFLLDEYGGAFPSGHETGVASAALLLLVALGLLRLARAARVLIVGLLVVWILLAALGLVRNGYHYATDTIGAVAVSVATVLTVALATDRWYAPVASRVGRRRQLT
jgi:membrane-associated phospholipid phosphatase